MSSVFAEAAGFDSTMAVSPGSHGELLRRHVAPIPYTRPDLYGEMLAGRPCVVTGYPVPLQPPYIDLPVDEVAPAINHWFATKANDDYHRVFTGPTGVRRDLTLAQIAEKWNQNRTRFGVTDLHIRNTDLEHIISPDVISGFNLLYRSTPGVQAQEMFSYVISSYGHVTDSHSDDPDSTNYCFTGKKLWLAWDTYEGARAGLQDVERVPVRKKAKFNFDAWLSLPSARWFLVEQGQTLFLPAHLTHKVVTLERYIGVGGFFIALPNCLRLLAHWLIHGPLWSKRDAIGERDHLLSELAETIRETILSMPAASPLEREMLAHDFLSMSAQHFIETCPPDHLKQLWDDPRFRRVADVIDARWPLAVHRKAA